MEFPTVDDVLQMHRQIIHDVGGVPGILHPGAIGSAIERMEWGPFLIGENLFARGALLLRGLAQDHPFVDGNKRTAFQATYVFLRMNGWTLIASESDVTTLMVEVASDAISLDAMETWLRRRAKTNTEAD